MSFVPFASCPGSHVGGGLVDVVSCKAAEFVSGAFFASVRAKS